ncbi:MAG: hypothetical protein AAGC60_00300 [Acidobacteriota bacterium]
MPVGAWLDLDAFLDPGPLGGTTVELHAELADAPGATPPVFDAVLERTDAAAHEATARVVALRITLDGEDVTADLGGPVTWTESVDAPIRTASVPLHGRHWRPERNAATWTRTPIEIEVTLGPRGATRTWIALRGHVARGRSTPEGVTLDAVDQGSQWLEQSPCLEVAPHAGLTTGAVCRSLAALAGVPATDIPDGAERSRPFSTGGTLLQALQTLGRRHLWSWRTDDDGTLVAERVRLRRWPLAADHTWHNRDALERPGVTPPDPIASRLVLRGQTAVAPAVDGLTVTVDTKTTRGPYTPAVATELQATDGTTSPSGLSTSTLLDTPLTIDEVLTVARGDLVVRRETTRFRWRTLETGVHETSQGAGAAGGGPGPDGLYPRAVWLAEGRAVVLPREAFLRDERLVEEFTHDADGTVTGARLRVYGWRRRRRAVRTAGSATIDLAGAHVAHDGASYEPAEVTPWGTTIEAWGLIEERESSYVYDEDTGARVRTLTATWRWDSPRRAETSPGYTNADGTTHFDFVDGWRRVADEVLDETPDRDGLAGSTRRVESGDVAPVGVTGPFPWGGEDRGYTEDSVYTVRSTEEATITTLDADHYQVERRVDGRAAPPEVYRGRPPLPAYRASPYTRLRQEPLETVVELPGVERWWGAREETRADDEAETLGELRALVAHDLETDQLAHEISTRRLLAQARAGQTIDHIDDDTGTTHRALLWSLQCTVDVVGTPTADGRYTLRAPVVDVGSALGATGGDA